MVGRPPKRVDLALLLQRTHRTTSGCIEYDHNRDSKGYGVVPFGGKENCKAHRVSWILHGKELPEGMWVLHRCDNPPCINPEHLYLGGRAENARDMAERKRTREQRGEANATARLNDVAVRVLRVLHAKGFTVTALADAYGVGKNTAWCAITRKTWRHVA